MQGAAPESETRIILGMDAETRRSEMASSRNFGLQTSVLALAMTTAQAKVFASCRVAQPLPTLAVSSGRASTVATMLQAQDEAIRKTDKPRENSNDGEAELGSELLKRLQKMEGIWYSDDFYGSHGREWVQISATLVGAGTSSLIAIKVSGDANVPSGYETWRTRGLPDMGGASVPAQIQIRSDVRDPNGFSWIPGAVMLVADDQIAVTVSRALFSFTGHFFKHTIGEGE